jgi:uncharacterized protein YndB with AHSA1/START domain
MAHAEQSVTIERPAVEVFRFLADGMNESKWRPDVTDVQPATSSGVGAVWRQTMKGPGGRSIRGDYRITRQDEPTLIEFEVIAGPARPTGRFVVAALTPTSTSVTFALDLQPRGLMRLLGSVIARQVVKEADAIRNVPGAMAREEP